MLEGDVNLLLEQIEDYKKQKEQALEEFAEIKVKNKLFTNTLKSKLDSIDRIDGDLLEE